MIQKLLAQWHKPDLGILVVRAALGIIFFAHGWQKLQDVSGTTAFFASIGLSAFFVYLVPWVELLGGAAMILGIFSRLAGLILAVNMIFAMILVKFKMGFLGGYEFDLALFAMALGVFLIGPGKYAARKDN